MAKRTVQHLRNHLSVFEPGFPIQTGYIAQLLLEHSIANVVRQVKAIVEAAEPDKNVNVEILHSRLSRFKKIIKGKKSKLTKEWPSLILLFLQPFAIPLKLPSAVTLTPPSSSSGYPEQTLDTLIQLNNAQTSTPSQTAPPNQTAPPINSQSRSATCSSPSAVRLKRSCANCFATQNANMNILRQNQHLRRQLREFKMLYAEEGGHFSLTRLIEEITRQVELINMWKDKYTTFETACRNTACLVKLKQVLEHKVKTLEEKLTAVQVKNINKAILIEQLKRMHKKTEIDDAHLKSYNTTPGPGMEITPEISWEEHPERSWWNGIADNDKEATNVAPNVSMEDVLCVERCQVEADGEYYMENPEVPCEHDTEDVNQRVTVENMEQPDLLSENKAASLYTKLCCPSSHSDI